MLYCMYNVCISVDELCFMQYHLGRADLISDGLISDLILCNTLPLTHTGASKLKLIPIEHNTNEVNGKLKWGH